MGINIALDGPSGAGKSTIAKAVAKKLGYIYVDTGALYRSIAFYVIIKGADTKSADSVIPLLSEINVEIKYIDEAQHIFLNSEDVSEKIRTTEVSMGASDVSAIPKVREFLFDLQRDIAKKNNIIMDGRDIGTVVLPNADVKIFLTASAEERAKRRFKELQEKGDSITFEQVLVDINQRDYNDSHREIAPLKQADDAILIDTSSLSLDESVEKIYSAVKEKIKVNSTPETVKKEKVNPVKMFFYQILRPIITGIYCLVYNYKIVGKENIPREGGNVFASNHRSYADPVIISLPVRVPFAYMAKEELFKNKLFSALITAFGAFPVSRGSGDLSVIDESIKRLNKGYNLVIFPEGTRSKDGTVGKGKTGVALIAAKAQVPVVPVGISYKGKLKFRRKVIVSFGKPITPEELKLTSNSPAELKVVKQKVMSAITELVELDVNKL